MYILIAESPFQLISIAEAIHYYRLSKVKIVIRCNGEDVNVHQMGYTANKLLSDYKISYVTIKRVRRSAYDVVVLIFNLIRILILSLVAKKVFIGDAESIIARMMIGAGISKKVIVLDDGVKTKNIYSKSIFSQYLTFINKINFTEVEGKKLEVHNFEFLRKKIEKQHVSDDAYIYLLGDKLVEIGAQHISDYLRDIGFCIDYLQRKFEGKVRYIPHRDEDAYKIKLIKKAYDVDCSYLDFPLELIALEPGVGNVVIGGLFSAALLSMNSIMNNIITISFRSKTMNINFQSQLEIYELFDREGIIIIDIE